MAKKTAIEIAKKIAKPLVMTALVTLGITLHGRAQKKTRAPPIKQRAGLGQPSPRDQCSKRPIAAETSAMRAEKPHSLSYHAKTRTVRPPTTLV